MTDGMTITDQLRKKEVARTPEEEVRQWFISTMIAAGIPAHMMMSEVGFRFGDKQYRADVLVYGRDGAPLAVVECKRPDVRISATVAEQAMRYNAVLSVKWIFLTNGKSSYVFRRRDGVFVPASRIPSYQEMLEG